MAGPDGHLTSDELFIISVAISRGSRDPVRLMRQVVDEFQRQMINDDSVPRIIDRINQLALMEQCICNSYLSADHDCPVHPRPGGYEDLKRLGKLPT